MRGLLQNHPRGGLHHECSFLESRCCLREEASMKAQSRDPSALALPNSDDGGHACRPNAIDPSFITRRAAIKSTLTAAGAFALAAKRASGAEVRATLHSRRASPRRYDMKKSINLWAFPYPDRMSLRE